MKLLLHVVIRLSACVVNRDLRPRWREEWLAEIDAAPHNLSTLRRTLGAIPDALSTRSVNAAGGWASAASGLSSDVRDALRSLRKTPVQTATIIACLTVGSTLTIAMFSVINGVIGGELPGVRDRSGLATVHIAHRVGERRSSVPMALTEFAALGETLPGTTSAAAELISGVAIDTNGGTSAAAAYVSGAYFQTLGTRPVIGRLLEPSDAAADAPQAAVLSYGFWQGRYGGSPDVIRHAIRIGSKIFQIVGVAPRDFVGLTAGKLGGTGDQQLSLWLPLRPQPSTYTRSVSVIARLAPGISIATAESQAQSAILAANARLNESQIASIRLEPFHLTQLTGSKEIAQFSSSFMAVPLIVLLIACANVGGVQLARAISRTHELAIRISIGADRWRVIRLLVVETLMLALSAAAIGWFLATQALRLLADLLPFVPVADTRVFVCSIVLPMLITIGAGLYPAWRATGFDVVSGLRLGARVGRMASPALRRRVLIAQTTLSVFLLLISLVLWRGLAHLPSIIGPSFDDVIVSEVRMAGLGLSDDQLIEYRRDIVNQLQASPGVSRVGASDGVVFFGSMASCWADASVAKSGPWEMRTANLVTPDYFSAMRITPLQGRLLHRDESDAALVNEAFVATYPSFALKVGSDIRVSIGQANSTRARIVGIVPDSYERYPKGLAEGVCYMPMTDRLVSSRFTVYAQSANPGTTMPALRRILAGVHPQLSAAKSGTIDEKLLQEYAGLSLVGRALGLISATALLLAMVGLFGAVSHGTSQRMHEFGVRLALGAKPAMLGVGIVRESLSVALTGLGLGIGLATPLAIFFHMRLLSTITLADPIVIASVSGAVMLIAVGAALLPARRASAINPVNALRAD